MSASKDQEINISDLTSIHINNLNNIQKIIDRLSKIGYIILSTIFTFVAIITSIIFNTNINWILKISLSCFLFLFIFIFYICHLINLRNEKIFRNIYNVKCKIDLTEYAQKKNPSFLILDIEENLENSKKEIHFFDKQNFLSWLSLIWLSIFLFSFCLIFFILFL